MFELTGFNPYMFVSFQAHTMADVLYKIDASSSEDTIKSQVCIIRHQT